MFQNVQWYFREFIIFLLKAGELYEIIMKICVITAIFLTKIYVLLNKPCVIYLHQFPNNSNENIRKNRW